MVMKKQIELKLFGLNETGVNELNEFYKDNIRENYIEPFQDRKSTRLNSSHRT